MLIPPFGFIAELYLGWRHKFMAFISALLIKTLPLHISAYLAVLAFSPINVCTGEEPQVGPGLTCADSKTREL